MQRLSCGCADPWSCRCHEAPPSERLVDAGRAAALHLLECGFAPVLPPDTLRALWRRGGTDHQLVQRLTGEGAA